MNKWGKRSKECRESTMPLINIVSDYVLKYKDIGQVYGYRNEEQQNEKFRLGLSKLEFPNSSHNQYPSLAGDFVVPPSEFKKLSEWCRMREYFAAGFGFLGLKMKPLIIFSDGSGDWAHVEIDINSYNKLYPGLSFEEWELKNADAIEYLLKKM